MCATPWRITTASPCASTSREQIDSGMEGADGVSHWLSAAPETPVNAVAWSADNLVAVACEHQVTILVRHGILMLCARRGRSHKRVRAPRRPALDSNQTLFTMPLVLTRAHAPASVSGSRTRAGTAAHLAHLHRRSRSARLKWGKQRCWRQRWTLQPPSSSTSSAPGAQQTASTCALWLALFHSPGRLCTAPPHEAGALWPFWVRIAGCACTSPQLGWTQPGRWHKTLRMAWLRTSALQCGGLRCVCFCKTQSVCTCVCVLTHGCMFLFRRR